MSYAVAVALARGSVSFEDFATSARDRMDVATLVPKVCMVTPSNGEEVGSIEIVLKDRTRLSARRVIPRGSPDDPPSWDDIIRKLRDGIIRAMQHASLHPETLFAAIRDLDKQRQFVDLLRA